MNYLDKSQGTIVQIILYSGAEEPVAMGVTYIPSQYLIWLHSSTAPQKIHLYIEIMKQCFPQYQTLLSHWLSWPPFKHTS